MTDPIIKTALKILDSVHDWQGEEGQTDATMLAAIVDAQVRVSLALLDEQRKTNGLLEQLVARKTATITVGHVSSNLTDEAREAIAAQVAWRNQAGGL